MYQNIEMLQAAYTVGLEKVKSDKELMANWDRLGISPKHIDVYLNTMNSLKFELVNN